LFRHAAADDETGKTVVDREMKIEVGPAALPRPRVLDSAAAVGLGRATPHASPR